MKRIAAVVLIVFMIIGMLGCQVEGDAGNTETEVTKESRWVNGKYDPPITITRVVRHNRSSTIFKEGEDWDNNVFTRWMEQKMGIKVKTMWVVSEENDAFAKKLNLAIAADGELPDVVSYRGSAETLNLLIDSGRFMAVDELFDTHANPIWKEESKKYPTMWYNVTRDGQKYGLPVLDYSLNTEPVLWIREDWMEKFGLRAPETIADLERIMEVFATQDPDRNGANDTYGLAVTLRNALNTWMTDLSWLFGAYGAVNGQWNKEGDALAWGSIQPAAKSALGKLNEWMAEGYIARDANTWDEAKASELFTSGKAGIIAGPHWMPDWPLPVLTQNVAGAKYKAYAVPAGPHGKRGVRAGGSSPTNGVVLINKESKHPEAFFHYYNYMLEHFANPGVGSEFEFGFAEGYDYKFVNGQLIKEGPGIVNPLDYSISFEGARIPDLMIETLVKLGTKEAETPYEKQVKAKRKKEEIDAAAIVLEYDRQGVRYPNLFEGEATRTMKLKLELLLQMEREAFSKIIYGQIPVDAFDGFVTQWKQAGGEQITEEVNEWYRLVNRQ